MGTFSRLYEGGAAAINAAVAAGATTVTAYVTAGGISTVKRHDLTDDVARERLIAMLPLTITGATRVQLVASFDNEKAAGAWTLDLPTA